MSPFSSFVKPLDPGRRCEEVDGCKELEENSSRERGMEGLDKGGQGPTSGCCAIEEEEEEEEEEEDGPLLSIMFLNV
jgi:hypothetical protein